MVFAAPFGEQCGVPQEWADASESPAAAADEGSLLEAFCEGAKLDVSALSGEEPAEIMRRAGAIYREMVLGLGDLVSERSTAKANLSLDRTTIGAADNNPLKWAPTQRVAIELLAGVETGFQQGPEAIRATFQDVKQHMLGTRRRLARCPGDHQPRHYRRQRRRQAHPVEGPAVAVLGGV